VSVVVSVEDFMEMAHVDACYDELMFLFRRAAIMSRMRSAEAMCTACEWSDDAIEISDPDNLIQVPRLSQLSPCCRKYPYIHRCFVASISDSNGTGFAYTFVLYMYL